MASYFCRTRGNKVYLYRQDYKNGKKKDVYIKASDWHLIGFKNTGSTEGNLRLVQDLNEKNRETKEIDSRLRAAERANREITANSQHTPEDDVREFHQRVKAEFFGTEKYFCKVICHIEFVLKMVAKLKIFPEKYADNSKLIYNYCREQKISVDYTNKIVAMANRWGEHYCAKRGLFYRKVKPPKGRIREAIAEVQSTVPGRRRAATPITFDEIEQFVPAIGRQKANYLLCGLAFGLRPEELAAVTKNPDIRIDSRTGKFVLVVYQSKLMAVSHIDRFKFIVAEYPEQIHALEVIKSKDLVKPTYKDVKK